MSYCNEQFLTKTDVKYHKYLTELYKTGIMKVYSEQNLVANYFDFSHYEKLFVNDGNYNAYFLMAWERIEYFEIK